MAQMINVQDAKDYIMANYPNDPLLKHITVSMLNQLPKVEAVEVVHGGWEYYSTTMQECSNCHRHTSKHKFKYCPHCGAKMDLEVTDGV